MGRHHRSSNKRHSASCTGCGHVTHGPISKKELLTHGMDRASTIADEIVVADVVQVGAGSAGAPYAKLRTDDRDVSVHLIESGRSQLDNPIVKSVNQRGAVTDTFVELHHYYPADPTPFPPDPYSGLFFPFAKGNGWGGGGVHYFLLMVRGTPAYWDRIAECSGNPLWRYDSVLPSMKFLETYDTFGLAPINTEQRGTRGPLTISRVPFGGLSPANPFVVALGVAGVSYTDDYNDPTKGVYVVGELEQSVKAASLDVSDPETQYSATAFLNTDVVVEDDNGDGVGVDGRQLFIDSESYAIRLIFDDELDDEEIDAIDAELGLGWRSGCGRCKRSRCGCKSAIAAERTVRGVRYISQDKIVDAFARERVVLSAGAIGDVEILIRSGIGPAALLDQLKIPVRLDNPNVGHNFQNHSATTVIFPPGPADPAIFTAFLPGEGSGPEGIRQIQLIGGAGFFGPPGVGMIVVNLQPAPVGVVEQRTRAFPDGLVIRFNPNTDPQDQRAMVEALKQLGRVSIAYVGALTLFPPPELFPNDAEFGPFGGLAPDDSALNAFVFANGSFLNHDGGSVRMSPTIETGVIDGEMNVHGITNLSITDLGALCDIADGNTAIAAFVAGMQKAKIDGAPVPF